MTAETILEKDETFLRVPIRKKDDYLRRLWHIEDFHGLIFFNQLTELGVEEEN